jgi:hypothetical protein
MGFRHFMSVVAVCFGSAACSVNPPASTAGSLPMPGSRVISTDPTMSVRAAPVEIAIALNPAHEPPSAPVVMPEPSASPLPAALTLLVGGPCGASPCSPPVTITCPTGTVAALREGVTCEPPIPTEICLPGLHPVLGDAVTCEK